MATNRYIKPKNATNTFNQIVAALTRRGISVWGSRVLYVRGRTSGEMRTARPHAVGPQPARRG
jgi:hypothetical protein